LIATWTPNSDQARAEAAQEVVRFGLGLGHHFRLTATFELDFLEHECDGVFGLVALGDHFADAGGESGRGGSEAHEEIRAVVFTELGSGKSVVGGLGFRVVEECGNRVVPFALRAHPALEVAIDNPEQLSGLGI